MSLGLLAVLSLVVLSGGCSKPDAAATAKCKDLTTSKNACKDCCKHNGDWGYEYVLATKCECSK